MRWLRCLFTASLLALALVAPAHAQNSVCPDVAAGDRSNRCANTRFVTSAAAALPLPNTYVYVGNSSNIAVGVPISGDCTITNLGVLICTKLNGVSPGALFPLNAAPAGTLTGATLNATVTASSLTSVGTLTGGATGAGFTVNLSTSTITGALPAANFPALTGDITTPGGSLATTLATVNANVGAFGGANSIPSFTVDGKGRITAAAANVPAIPFTEVTGQATYAQLPTASALSVLGRSANSSGVYADIQCTAAGGGVVKESSSTITCATLLNANISASAAIAYSKLANANANTVLSNWTSGSAALVANTWPACASDGLHALTYTNGTGVLCTSVSALSAIASGTTLANVSGSSAVPTATTPQAFNQGGFTGIPACGYAFADNAGPTAPAGVVSTTQIQINQIGYIILCTGTSWVGLAWTADGTNIRAANIGPVGASWSTNHLITDVTLQAGVGSCSATGVSDQTHPGCNDVGAPCHVAGVPTECNLFVVSKTTTPGTVDDVGLVLSGRQAVQGPSPTVQAVYPYYSPYMRNYTTGQATFAGETFRYYIAKLGTLHTILGDTTVGFGRYAAVASGTTASAFTAISIPTGMVSPNTKNVQFMVTNSGAAASLCGVSPYSGWTTAQLDWINNPGLTNLSLSTGLLGSIGNYGYVSSVAGCSALLTAYTDSYGGAP